jgi:phosphatidylglycerol lysyltransferase
MLASFCGSATDNAIGFGVLTGKAIRDRVYGAVGLGSEQIDRITLFNEMGFAIGLVSFAALSAMLAGSKVARWFSISTSALEFTAGAALIVILALAGNAMRGRKKGSGFRSSNADAATRNRLVSTLANDTRFVWCNSVPMVSPAGIL